MGYELRCGLVALACAVGCDAKEDDAPRSCDPLAPNEHPTELAAVVAVGSSNDGTIYVVEQMEYDEPRLFVTEGGTLWRVTIADWYGGINSQTFAVGDHEPPFTLQVELDDGGAQMGLRVGVAEDEPFTIGEVGEVLEIVAADSVADMPAYDTYPAGGIEHVARTLDGSTHVLVTHPIGAEGYDQYRVWSGPLDDLVEREIGMFWREKDGGTTTVFFDIDGAPASAYFPSDTNPSSATLTIDDVATEIEVLEPDAVPAGVFFCLG